MEGADVLARNASGRIVWRYPLEHSGRRPDYIPAAAGAAIGDLDGDGTNEVVVPVALSATPIVRAGTDMVLIFDARGRLRWKIQPELQVRHRGEVHTGPWVMTALAFSSEPPDRGATATTAASTARRPADCGRGSVSVLPTSGK